MNNSFKAGAAKIDITPPLGTLINGEFVPYYAHTIHDRLYAKSLILDDAVSKLVFVVVDICGMDGVFCNEIKDIIFEKLQIPASHITIASTHTHFSGSIVDLLGCHTDMGYRDNLKFKIVDSILAASQKMQAAQISFAKVDVPEHVTCRRYYMDDSYKAPNPVTGGFDKIKTNPFDGTHLIKSKVALEDPELSAIGVKTIEGEWLSVLANYSMHYVGDCANGTVTADYFGFFTSKIARLLNASDQFIGMLSNGTSGDMNIWDFYGNKNYPKEPHAKSELIGNDLAVKIAGAFNTATWENSAKLDAKLENVLARLRKPSATELEKAAAVVSKTDYRLIEFDSTMMERMYAREQILLNEFPDEINVPVQLMKVGQNYIGVLSGEFFAETGLRLKKAFKAKNYFTISMANDFVGYVPPRAEFENGGYETWRCRSSKLKEDTEERIRDTMEDLMANMAGNKS